MFWALPFCHKTLVILDVFVNRSLLFIVAACHHQPACCGNQAHLHRLSALTSLPCLWLSVTVAYCRALSAEPQPGQQSALQLVQTLIWLEQLASSWFGSRAVQAVRSALQGLRDAAVNVHGMYPLVLEMPDGFTTASTHMPPGGRSQYPPHRGYPATGWAAQLSRTLLDVEHAVGAITAGHLPGGGRGVRHAAGDLRQSTGKGWWEAIGADKVDKENLILTVLLGTLAALLWLRRRPAQRLPEERQQGDAATRAQPGQPPTRQLPAGAVGEALRQPRELPRPQL